jgi:hypothetical protein
MDDGFKTPTRLSQGNELFRVGVGIRKIKTIHKEIAHK